MGQVEKSLQALHQNMDTRFTAIEQRFDNHVHQAVEVSRNATPEPSKEPEPAQAKQQVEGAPQEPSTAPAPAPAAAPPAPPPEPERKRGVGMMRAHRKGGK